MTERLIGLVVLFSAAPLAGAVEVRIHSSVACASPVVRLADVAEIRGEDPALVAALGLITICPAPAVGLEQTLTQHQIRQHLALSGIELAQLIVTGSEQVLLLAAETPSAAARQAPPSTGAIRQALYSIESGVGKRSSITKGTSPPAASASTMANKKSELLVDRGASVTIHSNKPGIRITAPGKALESGAAGELIGVEVGDTRQRVTARIIGPELVEVASSTSAPVQSTSR
jgi:hypothetical protein